MIYHSHYPFTYRYPRPHHHHFPYPDPLICPEQVISIAFVVSLYHLRHSITGTLTLSLHGSIRLYHYHSTYHYNAPLDMILLLFGRRREEGTRSSRPASLIEHLRFSVDKVSFG